MAKMMETARLMVLANVHTATTEMRMRHHSGTIATTGTNTVTEKRNHGMRITVAKTDIRTTLMHLEGLHTAEGIPMITVGATRQNRTTRTAALKRTMETAPCQCITARMGNTAKILCFSTTPRSGSATLATARKQAA